MKHKKSTIWLVVSAVLIVAAIIVAVALGAGKGHGSFPFADMDANEIRSFQLLLQPPGSNTSFSDRGTIDELVHLLKDVEILGEYNPSPSMGGQMAEFTLTMSDGRTQIVAPSGTEFVIDGKWYTCEYLPSEALNKFANNLPRTPEAPAPEISEADTPLFSPAPAPKIDNADLKKGLDFQIISVGGSGTVLAKLTNVASPYEVVAYKDFWVSDESGNAIPFIEGVEFDAAAIILNTGGAEQYAFMVDELRANMKPGNYFINTNVLISAGDGEPTKKTISVMFTYGDKLTEIESGYAEKLATEYVASLNKGEDLTGNFNAMESWYKWLGEDNPEFRLQPDSLKERENTGGYEFKVSSIIVDAVYYATVYIGLNDSAIYCTKPLYYCPFSRYYPSVESCVQEYLTGLAKNNAEILAQVINQDDLPYEAAIKEAQRQLNYYTSRYDTSFLTESGHLMYDDYRQCFKQTILAGNDKGFVLTFRFGDGLVSIEPPPPVDTLP
jgi:hypothetical protein